LDANQAKWTKHTRKWHPDKNPEQKEKAKEMFLKIYKAFEFLKDEVAKLEYDEKIGKKEEGRIWWGTTNTEFSTEEGAFN